MCITLRPAKLSNTLIYAGDSYHPNTQKYVHVLSYQNRATSTDGTPNAMVLPIPAKGAMGRTNAISLVGHETLLKDLAKPLRERNTRRSMSRSVPKSFSLDVFDVGSYTVVLAADAQVAFDAISQVPENKRPELNQEIFDAFSKWYPGWHIAICCWRGDIKPEPLLWWYEPLDPHRLFYPMVDAHNGKAPNLNKDVRRDHTLLLGSTIHPIGLNSGVSDLGPSEGFISPYIWGRIMDDQDFNRDFTVDIAKMRTLENVDGKPVIHRVDSNIWDLEFSYYNPALH